jgi:hypothetical protein
MMDLVMTCLHAGSSARQRERICKRCPLLSSGRPAMTSGRVNAWQDDPTERLPALRSMHETMSQKYRRRNLGMTQIGPIADWQLFVMGSRKAAIL